MIRCQMVILIGAALIASNAFAEGDAAVGKTLFVVCQACHGPEGAGNQQLGAPRIAGQKDWYLRRQIRNFRAGARGVDPRDTFGLQMRAMAITLQDDQAIEDVVAYVGTFDAVPSETAITGDIENGREKFVLCAACHGEEGRGSEPFAAPRLDGQHDWYMSRQLQNFKADIRGNHDIDVYGRQMASMARTLSDEDLADVIAYINSLE